MVKKNRKQVARIVLSALLVALPLVFLPACAELQKLFGNMGSVGITPPKITVTALELVEYPSAAQIGAYFCRQTALAQMCQLFAGAAGPMNFSFRSNLIVQNQNAIALPVMQALVAFTAFPGLSGAQNLGAVCLSMCADPNNCPQGGQGACVSNEPQIKGIGDFAGAAVGFLTGMATGQQRLENLRIKTVPKGGQLRIPMTFSLSPEQTLGLLRTTASAVAGRAQQGEKVRFEIPYRFEGTLWVNAGGLGRIGVPVPAYAGAWTIF